MLLSASQDWERVSSFDDKTTLLHQYPYRLGNAALNAPSPESFHGADVVMFENEDLTDTTDPSTTDLSISLSLGPSVNVNNKSIVHQIPP